MVSGTALDDTLVGGADNEWLVGDEGNDTYLFGRGSGADAIYDTAGIDRVRFGAGITRANVRLRVVTGDMYPDSVTIDLGSGDRLTLYDGAMGTIEEFEFADGSVVSYADLVASSGALVAGDAAANSLAGTAGNDVLHGCTGADLLRGGWGDDRYEFSAGDGQDTVDDRQGTDTFAFGAGVTAGSVRIRRAFDENGIAQIYVGYGTGDSIKVLNADTHGIERFVFADGGVFTWDQMLLNQGGLDDVAARFIVIEGTSGDDVLRTSGHGKFRLIGHAGNDDLEGGDKDDELIGGAGDDLQRGGRGNNLYTFTAIGSGRDRVIGDGVPHGALDLTLPTHTLRLHGVTRSQLQLGGQFNDSVHEPDDLLLWWNNGASTVHYVGIPMRIELDDGFYDPHDLWQDVIVGTPGDDVMVGPGGQWSFDAGAGNDYILGDNGALGTGINVAQGHTSFTNNRFDGTGGINVLSGGGGSDDFITGSTGDFLAGGRDSDSFDINAGAHVIAFNGGEGRDTVRLASDTQTITFSLGTGIRLDDVYLTRYAGSNILFLQINANTGDEIQIEDWYAPRPTGSTVPRLYLQTINDGRLDYNPGGSDVRNNAHVSVYDLNGLIEDADVQRLLSTDGSRIRITDLLINRHLGSSDTAALGGDLAYRYGSNGGLTGFTLGAAQSSVSASGFGTTAQSLRTWGEINGGPADTLRLV